MRNPFPSSELHGCVNPVDAGSTSLWVSPGFSRVLFRVFLLGQKVAALCTVYERVLRAFFHVFFGKFSSVKSRFLHAVHRTNNNNKFIKPFYLLFIRRISS